MNQRKLNSLYKALAISICIFSIFFLVVPFGLAVNDSDEISDADGKIIKLNLISEIKEKVSTDAGSMFVDLTPEAVKIGLPDARLYGSVKQEQLVDQSTRMYINWHSLGIPTSQGEPLIDTLDNPLRSQVRTEDEKINVGEIITAQGDLDALIEKFLELKEQAEKKSPTTVIEEEEEDENDKNSLSADGTGSSSGAGGDYDTGLDSASDFSTNMVTSSWEDCEPRIAQDEGKVYRQARQVETDEEGNTVSIGQCTDHGGSVEVLKAYGSPCDVIYDYTNGKAYEQYHEWAELDGRTVAVTNCSNDFTRSYDIYGKKNACGVRHDFEAGRSIVQEQLFYMNNDGEEIQITECIDSDKAYAHYLTEATCSPYIDQVNNTVTIYKRTAYTLDDGTIEYASDCRAVDGGTRELFESYCDQKYEHDFTAGQSYYRTKDYYLNDNNDPVYLTECTRSTTTSFPHIYNASGCETVNDDENLRSVQYTSTSIETPDDGIMEISPCQDNGTTIPYTYMGIENRSAVFTSSGTWTVPNTVKKITVTLVAGGGKGGNGGPWSYNSSQDGYGKNGGDGAGDFGGGGGGGAGGEILENKSVTVSPGSNITVTIGSSNQNSTFGSYLTARMGYGSSGSNGTEGSSIRGGNGGRGGAGYGTLKLAKDGGDACGSTCSADTGGTAGIGYGAGGGGGAGASSPSFIYYNRGAGGNGAPGYCKVTWTVNVYKRADGTLYEGQVQW